jgi:signal transduction histidine kinase
MYPVVEYVTYVGMIAHTLFIPLFAWLGLPFMAVFNVFSVAAWTAARFANRRQRHGLATALLYVEVIAHAILACRFLGWNSGFHYYLLTTVPYLMFHDRLSTRTALIGSAATTAIYVGLRAATINVVPFSVAPSVIRVLEYFNIAIPLLALGGISAYFRFASIAVERHMESLNRVKTDFFQNVSHELRTPLTLIIGPLDAIVDAQFGAVSPPLKSRLDGVLNNARRLLRLINQLLDLGQLEAGRARLQVGRCDLNLLVKELAASFESAAASKDIRFVVDVPDRATPFFCDEEKVEKVLMNLLVNAFKFTDPGGKVLLRLSSGEPAVITVRDTGAGIAADDLPHIFERFWQASSGTARHQVGSGIGLALVKEFVELHGGRVSVTSQPGFGTEFEVRLPSLEGGGGADVVAAAEGGRRTSYDNVKAAVAESAGVPASSRPAGPAPRSRRRRPG